MNGVFWCLRYHLLVFFAKYSCAALVMPQSQNPLGRDIMILWAGPGWAEECTNHVVVAAAERLGVGRLRADLGQGLEGVDVEPL